MSNDEDKAIRELQSALKAIGSWKIERYKTLRHWTDSVDIPVTEDKDTLANMTWKLGMFIFRLDAIETFALAELKRIEYQNLA